jgi:hypothetical protein
VASLLQLLITTVQDLRDNFAGFRNDFTNTLNTSLLGDVDGIKTYEQSTVTVDGTVSVEPGVLPLDVVLLPASLPLNVGLVAIDNTLAFPTIPTVVADIVGCGGDSFAHTGLPINVTFINGSALTDPHLPVDLQQLAGVGLGSAVPVSGPIDVNLNELNGSSFSTIPVSGSVSVGTVPVTGTVGVSGTVNVDVVGTAFVIPVSVANQVDTSIQQIGTTSLAGLPGVVSVDLFSQHGIPTNAISGTGVPARVTLI